MFSLEEIKSFNDIELSVYHYIVKNKGKVAYMKIRELALESHVSTTTVLRFCKKLGCSGYSEFKLKFRRYLEEEELKKPGVDAQVIIDFMRRTETEEFQDSLDKLTEYLRKSKTIIFTGIGSSGILAKYGVRYFCDVGWFSFCVEDPFIPIFQGNSETTTVVALSVSGETEQIIKIVERMKMRGCHILSITNSENCTLARLSDANISYHMPQLRVYDRYDITYQAPVIYILECLGRKLYSPSQIEL